MKITSTNKKKGAFGFGALVQITQNIFNKSVHQLSRYFGTYGNVWYFLGIQVFFIDCMPRAKGSLVNQPEWRLSRFHFVPETFLRISWIKDIEVHSASGFEAHHTQYSDYNNPKDPDSKTEKVSEHRYLYLYSPWLIETFYGLHAPDKKVVVTIDGHDEIETHEFYRKIQRKKLLWWDSYRITSNWTDDDTEFKRSLDSYLSGDQ
jgi:hypothetical protein